MLFKHPIVNCPIPGDQFFGFEPEVDFFFSVLYRVGCVGEVAADFEGKVVADGAWGGLDGAGGAHGLPYGIHGVGTFPDHSHNRGRGNVFNETIVEGFAFMDGVVFFGELFADDDEFCCDNTQTAALQAGDYLADEATLDAIGFDEN